MPRTTNHLPEDDIQGPLIIPLSLTTQSGGVLDLIISDARAVAEEALFPRLAWVPRRLSLVSGCAGTRTTGNVYRLGVGVVWFLF